MTPKLKPGAEGLISKAADWRCENDHEAADWFEKGARWALDNLPKLLEATNKMCGGMFFDADFDQGKPVAIVEVADEPTSENN